MHESEVSTRATLIRNGVKFQLKLMADGFRDLVLMPVSLVATFIGLARGGENPQREFHQVIELGRESERWINLFGTHDLPDNTNAVASIDALFTKVEETLKQQYKASGTSKSAQAEIDEALHAALEEARQKGVKE